jgi:competence CoiA-like predicted nuclease
MLCAKRQSDGQSVIAYSASKKSNARFVCLQCDEEVIFKTGVVRVNHFAHANPLLCRYEAGESEDHRQCKMQIYEALRRQLGVDKAALERPLAGCASRNNRAFGQ